MRRAFAGIIHVEVRAREMVPRFPNVTGFHAVPHAQSFACEEYTEEVAQRVARFLSATRYGDAAGRTSSAHGGVSPTYVFA
jgi:hypothetical protein